MRHKLDNIRKILVLRYRSIGDILLSNPALIGLRHRFPKANIHMVVDAPFVELLYNNPNVDVVIKHARKPDRPRWKDDLEMIKKLRSEKYDLAVDLHGGPRSSWTTLFSGARIRIGHRFRWRNYICYNMGGEPPSPTDHTWYVQFLTVKPLGIESPEYPRFHLDLPESEAEAMIIRLESAGFAFDHPLVLLHPGARVDFKRWPAEKMGELARWLVDEKQAAVALAGSAADVEEIKKIRRASGYALPYFTDLSIGELATLIKTSSLIVCNDSGPMHMAGVLGTPVVALFGPSDPQVWEPVGRRKVIVTCPPLECMPCDQKGCPRAGNHCMTLIGVDEVKQAVERIGVI